MDLNPATNDERVLTDNYFDEIEGVRSDTGTVVFTNAMYRPGSRIYLMNLDGSYIRPLNPFHDGTFARCPVLSPNNSLLIVTRTEKKGIWLVRARTGELLTHENSPLVSGIRDYGDNAGWAAWSPDSTTIAYIDTRTNQLCSIKWDGTAKRKLTSGPFASLRVWGTYVGRLGKASRGVSGG
jgi:Tol biopolymer transport system component